MRQALIAETVDTVEQAMRALPRALAGPDITRQLAGQIIEEARAQTGMADREVDEDSEISNSDTSSAG